MNTCAYCGNEYKYKELTKEHTVNKSLIDFMELQNAPGYAKFSDNYTINYLTTKDVCADCNNGALSRLDKYSIEFMRDNSILNMSIDEDTKLDIKFDFNSLSKWLLKTIYNSERKNGYAEIENRMYIYNKHILGEENIPFEIYLEILKDVPKEQIYQYNKSIDNLKPFLKLGNVVFNSDKGIEYLKSFTISNLMFYVFILPRKESSHKVINDQVKAFKNLCEKESIRIFNLKKDYKYFSASRRTIIDILGDTYQGEKKFVEHADNIKKLTTTSTER